MSKARIFIPENRLAKALTSTTGPTTRELVHDAEVRVAALSDTIRDFVDGKVNDLIAHGSARGPDLLARLPVIESDAILIAEVAGAAKLDTIGAIATGIVAMADAHRRNGIWREDALRIHIEALTIVRATPGSPHKEDSSIVKQLQLMREAIGIVE